MVNYNGNTRKILMALIQTRGVRVLGWARMRRSRLSASHMDWLGPLCLQVEMMPSRVPTLGPSHLWGKLKIQEAETGIEFTFLVQLIMEGVAFEVSLCK